MHSRGTFSWRQWRQDSEEASQSDGRSELLWMEDRPLEENGQSGAAPDAVITQSRQTPPSRLGRPVAGRGHRKGHEIIFWRCIPAVAVTAAHITVGAGEASVCHQQVR